MSKNKIHRYLTTKCVLCVAMAISAAPGLAQTYSALWSFNGDDGAQPAAGVILDPSRNGNVYGTTSGGGTRSSGTSFGTVFRLKAPASPGGAWSEKVMQVFTSATEYPYARLFRQGGLGTTGNLYGTTRGGCCTNVGTGSVLFEISTTDVETVLFTFSDASDGAYPYDGVTLDDQGNVYGTTTYGGNLSGECASIGLFPGCGILYKLDLSHTQTVIHSFAGGGDGATPGPIVRETDGNIFGAAMYGGNLAGACAPHGCGYLYEYDNAERFKVLYRFSGGTGGMNPYGRLIRDGAGNLYGVASGGLGYGIVYKVDLAGKLTVLYSFTGGSDGANPSGGLVLSSVDPGASLFGTTRWGGLTGGVCGNDGCGVVFKLASTGEETVLHTFAGPDGQTPNPDLEIDSAGNLYGTTSYGGNTNCTSGCGVMFMIEP